MPSIIPDNLMYILEFQRQYIYHINLPLTTIPSENLIYTIEHRTIMAFLCERMIPRGGVYLNLKNLSIYYIKDTPYKT